VVPGARQAKFKAANSRKESSESHMYAHPVFGGS
jgi:hypothetical protein